MRLLRAAGALLAAGLALGGCGDAAASGAAPTPSTSGPTPAPTPTRPLISGAAVGAGSDGLTVRYTDSDGVPRTLRVEDFPR